MIPSKGIASMYAKIMGDQTLLAMAQGNLLSNLERVGKVRTHTFIAFNGQTEHGISQNYGAERYYSWEDTTIDCRNAPDLANSDRIKALDDALSENARFKKFKEDIEKRMNGYVTVEPFHSVLRGEENMRYNIKRKSKIEDFDIIRVGVRLMARDEDAFKAGLHALKDMDNPFKIKTRALNPEPDLQMA